MKESMQTKEKFDTLYEEWLKVLEDPKTQFSSRPQDYTNNEPYRKIVALGKDALPFILEKMAQGVFFMNQAAMEVAGLNLDSMVEKEAKAPPDKRAAFMAKGTPQFLSEQQKSALILKYAQKGDV